MSDLHDFYFLAGTGAATLVGRLFVGLSLHLRVVVAASEVRSLARMTLANFGAVLFVCLFMVITEDRSAAALQLIGSGVVSLVITAPSLLMAARNGRTMEMRRLDRARLILRFGLSDVSYLAIVVLLVVSLRNTWDLLVTVGDVTLGDEQTKD